MQFVLQSNDADLESVLIKKANLKNDEHIKLIKDTCQWLGLFSNNPLPSVDPKTLLDYLTALFQSKMAYQKDERDMVFLILNIRNYCVVYNICTVHCDCGLSKDFMNRSFLSYYLCCFMFLSLSFW